MKNEHQKQLQLPEAWKPLFPGAEEHARQCRDSFERELTLWEGNEVILIRLCGKPFEYEHVGDLPAFEGGSPELLREIGVLPVYLFPFDLPEDFYGHNMRREYDGDAFIMDRLYRVAALTDAQTLMLPQSLSIQQLLPLDLFRQIPCAAGTLYDIFRRLPEPSDDLYPLTHDGPFPKEPIKILDKQDVNKYVKGRL